MCRDYELARSMRSYRKLLDDEFERRRRQGLRWIAPELEPNDFTFTDAELTRPAPIIRAHGDKGCEMVKAIWWFVPASHHGTVKDWARKTTSFNARSDNLAKSPTFRHAFANRRCLVPASGWYEWTEPQGWKKGKPKTKWRIMQGDHEPIFFAGIWDGFDNSDPEAPGPTDTFALVTHDAGPGVDRIHDRAPVVLPAEAWADWLDRGYEEPLSLLPPASAANAYTAEYVSGPTPAQPSPQGALLCIDRPNARCRRRIAGVPPVRDRALVARDDEGSDR